MIPTTSSTSEAIYMLDGYKSTDHQNYSTIYQNEANKYVLALKYITRAIHIFALHKFFGYSIMHNHKIEARLQEQSYSQSEKMRDTLLFGVMPIDQNQDRKRTKQGKRGGCVLHDYIQDRLDRNEPHVIKEQIYCHSIVDIYFTLIILFSILLAYK
ncbi:hypothetical protein ACJX0J_041384 [Zea mays]